MDFSNLVLFLGEAKIYLDCMYFRSPPAVLKQKTENIYKFINRHVSNQLNVLYIFYEHASFFQFSIFGRFAATHLCAENDNGLEGLLCGDNPCVVFIGPIFHNTIAIEFRKW